MISSPVMSGSEFAGPPFTELSGLGRPINAGVLLQAATEAKTIPEFKAALRSLVKISQEVF